jgi:hypothetical protein
LTPPELCFGVQMTGRLILEISLDEARSKKLLKQG